jgi:hypothetical protein
MPNVVRIKRHLDSETVHLPELRELVGHDVEIVVREITAAAHGQDLKGSVLRFDDPMEPIDEEWEADE